MANVHPATLLGSPENRRVLRAEALAKGYVGPGVNDNWEVSVGSSIYRMIVPLSTFATGSQEWRDEMEILAGANPAGGGGTDIVEPPIDPSDIKGPFDADGMPFWIRCSDCRVGFDVMDGDANPDSFVTKEHISGMHISQVKKTIIYTELENNGCS